MNHKIRLVEETIKPIINEIKEMGYEAYITGKGLRRLFSDKNIDINHFEITTSATEKELEKIFSTSIRENSKGYKEIVISNKDDMTIKILPSTNINEYLENKKFAINKIAYDGESFVKDKNFAHDIRRNSVFIRDEALTIDTLKDILQLRYERYGIGSYAEIGQMIENLDLCFFGDIFSRAFLLKSSNQLKTLLDFGFFNRKDVAKNMSYSADSRLQGAFYILGYRQDDILNEIKRKCSITFADDERILASYIAMGYIFDDLKDKGYMNINYEDFLNNLNVKSNDFILDNISKIKNNEDFIIRNSIETINKKAETDIMFLAMILIKYYRY